MRWLLLAGIALASLLLFASGTRHPSVPLISATPGSVARPALAPVKLLPGEVKQLSIPELAPGTRVVLDVSYRGTLQLLVNGARNASRDVIVLGNPQWCRSGSTGISCHVAVQLTDKPALTLYSPHGAELRSAGLRVTRRTQPARHRPMAVVVVVILVAASLPICWVLRRRRAVCEWILAGVGISAVSALHPAFGVLLLGLLAVLWQTGLLMRRGAHRTVAFASGVLLPVGLLVAFKYGGASLARLVSTPFAFPLGLPLGLSYFVIRLVDTQFRWYRGELRTVTLREYLAYTLFPATIPAGPIETLDHFVNARIPELSRRDVAIGLSRVVLGVAKKVVIADVLFGRMLWVGGPSLFDSVVADPLAAPVGKVALLLSLSFVYAYVDFSAYSDISIGLARMYGYVIVENFDWPILARDLRDFWRRWHISLSNWCFRNIYVPLTISTRSSLLPLLVVMLTVGLWHAANASWAAWAYHHAVGLALLAVLQKRARRRGSRGMPRMLATLATLTFVIAGHAFVLIEDFPTALQTYLRFWTTFVPLP